MFETGDYGYVSDYLWWYVGLTSLFVHTWCFFKLCKPDRHPRLRLIGGNALVALCMLGVVALGGETYLRFVSTETDGYGASLTARRWHKAYARLNSLNCRDVEWAVDKPPGVRRIAFIGDSVTYGWGIKNPQDRFTNLLQTRFDARAPGTVEVMNVAWPNWDTDSELAALRTVVKEYDVDEVVLCYLPNDIMTLLPWVDGQDPRALPKQFVINTDSSFLIDYLYNRIATGMLDVVRNYCNVIADAYRDPDIWARQQAQLDEFIRICREHDVDLRVALLPFLRVWGDRYDGPALHRLLSAYFASRGIDVVDLLPTISGYDPNDLVVNARDAHPNELGHRLFADAMWNALYAR